MFKTVEVSLLYDFYGQLLTEKQQKVLELYYNDDLSLGEIAEILTITRQAVYDNIKRAEKSLYNYENKLRLVKKFLIQNDKIRNLKNKLVHYRNEKEVSNFKMQELLRNIEEDIEKLLID